jgi:hypothetical protein
VRRYCACAVGLLHSIQEAHENSPAAPRHTKLRPPIFSPSPTYRDKSGQGKFEPGRKTARKKFERKAKKLNRWLRPVGDGEKSYQRSREKGLTEDRRFPASNRLPKPRIRALLCIVPSSRRGVAEMRPAGGEIHARGCPRDTTARGGYHVYSGSNQPAKVFEG